MLTAAGVVGSVGLGLWVYYCWVVTERKEKGEESSEGGERGVRVECCSGDFSWIRMGKTFSTFCSSHLSHLQRCC